MKYNWILDVLADLRTFAVANDLQALAEQLEEARLVAVTEIVSTVEGAGATAHGHDATTRDYTGGTRERPRA
ncbi:hypothetical protein PH7735_02984 [Shimia thalassica]|uniref:Uncharacterized protein n=1 Tax=Shimia thalassica TaxID=1715693 RepID=A0A0N7MA15_9RHOB|nr:hypothetical protein CSC82_06680 [Rhodobacteraceae bacterium 4F10]CUK06067.1 hypothetical protein PH7735_02984 [Shimia thalassica]